MGVASGVSPGEAAEPWLSSDFSSSTFRAPLTSAIPAFPSLLAPGLLTVPFPPGTGFLDLLGGLLRSRFPLLPSSQGLPFDLSPSGLKDSQQLCPAALPLQPGADAAQPGSSGSRGGGGGGEALSAGLPPYIIRQLIIIEAARFNPLPASRVRRAGAAPAAGTARCRRPPAPSPSRPDFLVLQLSTKEKHVWHREAAPLPTLRPAQPGPTSHLKWQGGNDNPTGIRVEA